jgi:hypothetical protein
MKYNFIKTSDLSAMNELIKSGFQKVDESNGIYTFLNSDKIQFSKNVNKSKIQYSNMLNI